MLVFSENIFFINLQVIKPEGSGNDYPGCAICHSVTHFDQVHAGIEIQIADGIHCDAGNRI